MADEQALKKTALHLTHVAAGARMVEFGGWDMPVQYANGIISEVRAVRENAGIFDVSHMARFQFVGPEAVAFLDRMLAADVAGLQQGRARYHVICNERGGIIDDAIVYRVTEDQCLLVANAGNADAVKEFLIPAAQQNGGVFFADLSEDVAMIAVQGPNAVEILDRICPLPASSVRPFRLRRAEVAGIPSRIARTGYTGEDGFEIMPPSDRAAELWRALEDEGVAPAGLGARDVLRLEAGLMLHGNDMTVENNPYEAGLERFTHIDTPGYIAGDALKAVKNAGTARVMVGFNMVGRGIPRHRQAVMKGGVHVGIVTSGTHSPTLDANIGMGYVDRDLSNEGSRFEIDVRGRLVEAEVVPLPFYSRKRV
ncbi:MAG TPA: glycine cleavage system aminomethyltransferase GcvT [Dehalococcoidia bacterium]|jgi:aminomethyltransferase|nr:glycine cleavage system protein T [Chloroflexota bacterium]MDP5877985.1 glycine cleavage system aminomethyltransferase GcvT [Dehalococcoidia bacterium]MDP6272877.1 glycine cleavage system aminomethyltransferase GcvT [Dehalococcoidia bacterium]MDP7161707.1 glycine cleavage system aminomethyltransferase GcvT [Dehalococcoidia bacterium]MDP7213765.1 glycine cleavage system aminomethyltransferase GcvT [Dehalococcoidia bacterium]|tara:strand:- start:2686 stop:3789 length:1104 start_codon:yes stop_codon:yes gene_type:complete